MTKKIIKLEKKIQTIIIKCGHSVSFSDGSFGSVVVALGLYLQANTD